jgi:phenylpropionate dioxygenase-like ring-hydroxylating dioxygenase large terminal subunit
MINLIPPSGYTDEKKFISEQKLIFQSQWQCIGFTIELEQHNDFIARLVGGRPIVIQNFRGELRAFDNICRHRHSIIQCDPKGNRGLTCPYHGWTYDRSGIAIGISRKNDFSSSLIDDLANITLRCYRVETSGKFVFVSLDDNAISLASFLGESDTFLRGISNSFGKRIDEFELLEQTNWKIGVENTLDFYHVNSVHRDSLAKIMVKEESKVLQDPHSHTVISLSAQNDLRRQKLNALLAERPCKFEGYVHHLIFPNLTIATTQGMSFSVQLFEPVSPGVTRFTTSVFAIDYENCPRAVAEALARQVAEYNRQVFLEDQVICEAVQQGLERSDDSHPGLLNGCESRILGFQQAYNAIINKSEAIEFNNRYSFSEQELCLN